MEILSIILSAQPETTTGISIIKFVTTVIAIGIFIWLVKREEPKVRK